MEVWAVVACVASVVQLVDFTSRSISKSVELHHSVHGVHESNAALENVVEHLKELKDEVDVAATAVSDPGLHNLCSSVASAAEDLLGALNKLKLKSPQNRWSSLRKGMRTVWSKDQIHDLERRLAGFRDELNLHIVVRLRQQLISTESSLQAHIKSSDAKAQEILSAILDQRDVFAAESRDFQTQTVRLHQATEDSIQGSKAAVLASIARQGAQSTAKNKEEHDLSRHLVQSEALRLGEQNEELQETTVAAIQSSETVIVTSIEDTDEFNRAEHIQTQSQIAELKASIDILVEQIKARDLELKQLITEFNETRNTARRKRIGEKSSAVTAALLALETMYRTLLSVLQTLESSAKDLLNHARTVEIWKITSYASKFSTTSRTAHHGAGMTGEASELQPILSNKETALSNHNGLLLTSQFAHQRYFSSYHTPIVDSAHIINGSKMEALWPVRPEILEIGDLGVGYEGVCVDSGSCNSGQLWLIASVVAVLNKYLSGETPMTYNLLAIIMDQSKYLKGGFSGRLKADISYWGSFARSRGLDSVIDPAKVPLHQCPEEDFEEVCELLSWIITSRTHYNTRTGLFKTLTIRRDGPAYLMAEALKKAGLHVDLKDPITVQGLMEDEGFRYEAGSRDPFTQYMVLYCVHCWKIKVLNGRNFSPTTGGGIVEDSCFNDSQLLAEKYTLKREGVGKQQVMSI